VKLALAFRRPPIVATAVGLAFFGLYFWTLQPDQVGHDAGELQFVPYVFGIPHYTGYPLYLLVGKAWSILPLGSVAYRMNVLSAVFGGLAAAVTYLCGVELTASALGGLVAALAVGLAPLEWTWSTIAGVRSLAMAFVALALLAVLRWERALREGEAKLADRRFILVALIAGFAVDHHRTFVLLLPFLAIYVLLVQRDVLSRPALLAKAGAAFAAPLLLYGVLPLRARLGAPYDQWNTGTWQGFAKVALAGENTAFHMNLTPAQIVGRLPELGPALSGAFPGIALALAVVGALVLLPHRPALFVLLTGYTAVLAWLVIAWNIGGQLNLVYLMPAYVPLALLAAAGLAPPAIEMGSLAMQAGRGLLVAAVAAGGIYTGRQHFQPPSEALDDFRQNLFEGHQARRLARAMGALPPGATIVADWDQATPLWYAQFVDGINRGAAISYPASTLPAILERSSGPVFLATASFPPPSGTLVSAVGPFVQVLRQTSTTLPPTATPLGGPFGQDVQLAAMSPIGQPQFGVLPLTLYWTALRQPAADYHVSVRLMPGPDRVAAQRDEAAPVLGLSPTSSWTAGQITADYYELDVRPLADGAYDLAVILYQPQPDGSFRNLPYGGSDRAVIGKLTLTRGRASFTPAS
jgi:hypothetical protein